MTFTDYVSYVITSTRKTLCVRQFTGSPLFQFMIILQICAITSSLLLVDIQVTTELTNMLSCNKCRIVYNNDQLLEFNATLHSKNDKLPDPVFRRIRNLKICKLPHQHRGCRGGKKRKETLRNSLCTHAESITCSDSGCNQKNIPIRVACRRECSKKTQTQRGVCKENVINIKTTSEIASEEKRLKFLSVNAQSIRKKHT